MASSDRGKIRIIPPEIVTEILYRLPAKSIGRFRSVSKGWLSLLTDPQFIKTHRNTLNQLHFIFTSKYGDINSLPFYQIHEEEEEKQAVLLKPTKIHVDLPDDDINLEGSCNGLVLVSVDGFGRVLYVLNPMNREFVELPVSGYEMVDNVMKYAVRYGFGYDCVTDDYKLVTISDLHYNYNYLQGGYLIPPDVMSVHIYSLRTNTWRSVDDSPYDHSRGFSLSGVLVNGFLHWMAEKKGSSNDHLSVIVAFSLADEKFREVPSPNLCNEDVDIMFKDDCKLVVLGEKLAIFREFKGEVWMMNEYGVSDSWTKIIIHGFSEVPLVEPMIFYDNGRIILATGDLMLIYNVEERTFCKSVDISWNHKYVKVGGTYVESLVSPKFT